MKKHPNSYGREIIPHLPGLTDAMQRLAIVIGTKYASEPNDLKVRHEMCKIQNELDEFCEYDPEFQGDWFTVVIDSVLDMADAVRKNLRAGL